MPIFGSSPKDCYDRFAAHLRELLASVLSQPTPLLIQWVGNDVRLSFWENGPATVPVHTKVGLLHFYIAQGLHAERDQTRGGRARFRLTTTHYWYRLQAKAGLKAPALIRWEYDSSMREGNRPARNHVQISAEVETGSGTNLHLNKLHTPTGWVTIEEVLRFLFVDLEVKSCARDWAQKLVKSEAAFYKRFSGKRYKPPTKATAKPKR